MSSLVQYSSLGFTVLYCTMLYRFQWSRVQYSVIILLSQVVITRTLERYCPDTWLPQLGKTLSLLVSLSLSGAVSNMLYLSETLTTLWNTQYYSTKVRDAQYPSETIRETLYPFVTTRNALYPPVNIRETLYPPVIIR